MKDFRELLSRARATVGEANESWNCLRLTKEWNNFQIVSEKRDKLIEETRKMFDSMSLEEKQQCGYIYIGNQEEIFQKIVISE